jgi:type IV pilus assembly protein PilB
VESTVGYPLVVQLLMDKGLLTSEQLSVHGEILAADDNRREAAIVESELVGEEEIAQVYSEYLMAPLYDAPMDNSVVDRALAQYIPEKLCREHAIAPVAVDDEGISIAFTGPNSLLIADEIEFLSGLSVKPLITTRSVVDGLIDAYCSTDGKYRARKSTKKVAKKTGKRDGAKAKDDDEMPSDDGPSGEVLDLDEALPAGPDGRTILIVNQILEQAMGRGASDIHIEPFEETCKVRIRVDGVLHELVPPPRNLYLPVVSRFVDLRVSTVPTVWGEKIVMRILDKGAIPVQLTGLGFDERQSKDLMESIDMPHGLMLVTGPTGSGKSTTLYACLNYRNQPGVNICTVEDPVEYKFEGMNQIQVKAQVGLTFASVLRAFLRQDPDVIMVGEVRDQETAQICLRAALTGHFVLSTIHTNDSLSAISRLQDMGIEAFLLAATMRVLEAQRLIRRLCKECKQPYTCDEATATKYGLEAGQELFKPKGCDACRGAGYRGRVGVFEVVRITPNMGDLIQRSTPLPEMREAARGEGMKMLADSALDKVRMGLTSLEEALSISTSD